MANRNWNDTYLKYLEALQDEPLLSMAEFARRIGENINTARRALNKAKVSYETSSDRSLDARDRSLKSGKKTKTTSKGENTGKSKGSSRKASKTGSERAPSKTPAHLDRSLAEISERPLTFPSRSNIGDRPCRGDGYQGVKHGAYMDFAKLDSDIRDAANELNEDDGVVTLQAARYLQLYRNLQEMIEAIETDYAGGNTWKDEFGNDMPKSKALASAVYGTSKPMTELENAIQKNKMAVAKQQLDEEKHLIDLHNLHPLSKKTQIAETNRLLKHIRENELSFVLGGYMFEELGIEVPKMLMAEATKEISMRQPQKEILEEITAEQLDREMAKFNAQRQEWRGDWLKERMQGLEELKQIDANGGIEVIE